MNDLNKNLLSSIESVDDIIFESEMNVLHSIIDEYSKIGMLMEYADESVVNEFLIIQEAGIILEAGSKTKETEKTDTAKQKKENIFIRVGKTILKAIKTVFTLIIKGYVWLIEKWVSLFDFEFSLTVDNSDNRKIARLKELVERVYNKRY